jgi:hypothetical protein
MPQGRHTFRIVSSIFVAAGLVLAGMHSATSQTRGKAPPPSRGPGPVALHEGQEITFTTPQFKVEALWIKSNDETGWYWTGSDEVYAIFSDMDPTHTDRTTSEYELDEGDTANFGASDTCMAPQPNCDRGMADLNVRFSFWESDWAAPLGFSYCNKPDSPGIRWRLHFGKCIDDDFIGEGSIIHNAADLVAMLPDVESSREFTHVMDKNAGKFRFRYRITRMPNIERTIVIHLPPDFGLPPAINLQAMLGGGIGGAVTLTWSGATTSSVDLYRNGSIIVTTPNDGNHVDSPGSGTHQYRLCNQGSTSACSAQVQVIVP